MPRIQQHDLTQLRGGRRCYDFSPEPVFYQLGDPAAVVNMGMGQKKRTYFFWIKTPLLPVTLLHLSSALKKATINQHLFSLRVFDQIAGSGDGSYAAQTNYSDHGFSPFLCWLLSNSIPPCNG